MITIPNEVIALFKSDNAYKNFRVTFPNGERGDITNADVVSESVSFTESICSQNTLKFGLCETPMIQFETVGVENIKGSTINCYIEIECPSTVTGAVYKADLQKYVYVIQYGQFVVESCPRQTDMTHRKVTAYQRNAMDSWQFPDEMKRAFSIMKWYKQNDFKISIESLFKIMGFYAPTYTRQSTSTTSQDKIFAYTYKRINNVRKAISFHIIYDGYVLVNGGNNDALFMVKPVFTSGYKSKVQELYEWVMNPEEPVDRDYLSDIPKFSYLEYESISQLAYSKNLTPTGGTYGYIDPPTSSGYYRRAFFPDDKPVFVPCFNYEETGEDGTIWYTSMGLEEYMTSGGPYISVTNFIVPTRMYVKDNDNNILFDTGSFDNYLMRDTNEIPIISSDLNIFFKPTSTNVKQKFRNWTNGTYSNVTKTVYQLDWSQLESLAMGDFVCDSLEANGLFGRVKRDGELEEFSIENSNEYDIQKSDYESIWYDEAYTKKYGRIVCNYTANGVDNSIIHDIVADYNDTINKTYTIANNSMLDLNNYTEQDVINMLTDMADNIDDIQYMPATLRMKGMPWIEAGDYLNVDTPNDGVIRMLVERHTISGIQVLKDSVECRDEVMENTSLSVLYDPNAEMLIIGG